MDRRDDVATVGIAGGWTAVALFAVAGLIGGLGQIWMARAATPVLVLTAAGVACVAYAAITLIRESIRLLAVIEGHRDELVGDEQD